MKRQLVFYGIFFLFCFSILLFGYLTWQEKLNSVLPTTSTIVEDDGSETSTIDNSDDDLNSINEESDDVNIIQTISNNMDDAVRSVFEDRLSKGEKIDFLFLGSDLMEMGEPNMYTLVSEALTTTYGDSMNISKQTFNETSLTVMNEDLISFDGEYDVILFEPFTLKNNGEVDMETEHAHVTSIVTSFREQVGDAAVVFTPPNPIYNATYYPVQINGLKTYLDSRGYLLVDHWDNWPDPTDEAIKEYLDDQSRPNEQGAAAWADALITYFTGSN